jgi:hypothetical protein
MPAATTTPTVVDVSAPTQSTAATLVLQGKQLARKATHATTTPPKSAGHIKNSNIHHTLSAGANCDGGAPTPSRAHENKASKLAARA